jgi:hypothetical protein
MGKIRHVKHLKARHGAISIRYRTPFQHLPDVSPELKYKAAQLKKSVPKILPYGTMSISGSGAADASSTRFLPSLPMLMPTARPIHGLPRRAQARHRTCDSD